MTLTEEEVLKLNSVWESYSYCTQNQHTANVEAHEKIIIDSKRYTYYYWFARDIINSNKELLFKELLSSSDLLLIKTFYNTLCFDKSKYETLMLFL
jgi:hypothetical protein